MAIDHFIAALLCEFVKLLTGVRALWRGSLPEDRRRIYFANHRSHCDFVLIWAALPSHLRRKTRPVAGADYWLTSALRRYIINRLFRGVLVDRTAGRAQGNPVELMGAALSAGESLIIFPEGTRNLGDDLLPFKSGLYHLAKAHPEAELLPVWIENLGRVMPKGALLPVPLLCSLTFGAALRLADGESKDVFLQRARDALLALAPPAD
jgi:1-acyl-sn-glycerol-3-phosphate acyltransferase